MAAVINMWVGMLQEEHTRHWFCVFAVSLQTFCPQMHRVRSVWRALGCEASKCKARHTACVGKWDYWKGTEHINTGQALLFASSLLQSLLPLW